MTKRITASNFPALIMSVDSRGDMFDNLRQSRNKREDNPDQLMT